MGEGCAPTPESAPEAPARQPDVVVMSLDTVRADHVSALFPTKHRTTPHLERLPGVRFPNCWAPAPYTGASHAALLSGQYRSAIHHGVHPNHFNAAEIVMPALFAEAGYRTVAITSGGFMGPNWGVKRGFDEFEHPEEPHIGEEVGIARTWLAQYARAAATPEGPPLFLFLHTFLPHSPYVSTRFGQEMEDRYDGDIFEADRFVGKVWQVLDKLREARDRALVLVVVSDHGEEFGERGRMGLHTFSLHRELLHVPCFWFETALPTRVVRERVGLIDVAQSLLERAGLPVPGAMEGLSLLPLIRGEVWDDGGRPLFAARASGPGEMAYRAADGQGTLIHEPKYGPWFYGPWDPGERGKVRPEGSTLEHAALMTELHGFSSRWTDAPQPEPSIDAKMRRQLEVLGYIDEDGNIQR